MTSSYFGLVDFEKAFQSQLDCQQRVAKSSREIFVLGFEHPTVITLGRRASKTEVILDSSFPIVKTNRGGLATLHSPGQLVIYPILNLREFNLGVRQYVDLLMRSTQELLKIYGIDCIYNPKLIGLYSSRGKLAFCGIEIIHSVSMHGISINVGNDLNLFQAISACGALENHLDRMLDYPGCPTSLEKIFRQWSSLFQSYLPV